MQKQLALLNEDEFSEIESNRGDDQNEIYIKSFQKFREIIKIF